MVEAAVLTTLGWVVSPLMKMLLDKAQKFLGTSINEKTEILEATALPRLSLAIEKAEKSPNKGKLKLWLKRLKHAYYQAEQAIDICEYELLEQKVMGNRNTLNKKMKSGARKLISKASKKELEGCIDKLIEIAKEASEFSDLLEAYETADTSNPDRDTISQPSGRVFGREIDKEIIVSGLLTGHSGIGNSRVVRSVYQVYRKLSRVLGRELGPSTAPAIPIIAIVGRSGIGKTTLSQHVYQYMEKQNYFDLLIWVHCPRKFMAADVVKKILQNKNAKANYDRSISLEALRNEMKGMLSSKKFLLVLDDFWCDAKEDREQWEKFISCFSGCFSGWSPKSKILLTTQNDDAVEQASIADATETVKYYLPEIGGGHLFELFMHEANWPSDCSIPREEFDDVGRKIAAKLKGDPGAAKIVGRQLRGKYDIMDWEKIAAKDWSEDKDNMKARIWSYQQLPVHIQRCFAICCLFPKGVQLPGELLVHFWMAEGFIKPTDNEERMEDIGESYLNELVCRFFLEKHVDNEKGIYYQLHDLLHDLAEQVQGDDFFRIDCTDFKNIPEHIHLMLSQSENIRHISLPACMINDLKEEICCMKNLHTLQFPETNYIVPKKVLEEILKNSTKLRVLFIPLCCNDLPDCFGNLKHLRFLHIIGSLPLQDLPASICKLYLLQTLILPSCKSIPNEFSKLISLRQISTQVETIIPISDVGRLTSLQALNEFAVRKECGYELHQLEKLNQLRGTLSITGLVNVSSIEDAVKANMSSKRHLEELEFHWNADKKGADHFGLLNALEPHSKIRGITIYGYGGNIFPNWLVGQNLLKHLVKLHIINCPNVDEISFKSLPNIKLLQLSFLNNLKQLPLLPQSLTDVLINNIPQIIYFSKNDFSMKEERKQLILQAVEQITGHMKSRYALQVFEIIEVAVRRCLQFVKERLESAPETSWMKDFDPWNKDYPMNQLLKLWKMFMKCHIETMLNKNESQLILPSSITRLVISSCSITSDALSNCIQRLVSLSELCLMGIQTITSLPPEEALCDLKNLSYLRIEHCFLLSSLGGIRALTSLIELQMSGCLSLNSSDQQLPSSLETLKFEECANVDVILDQSYLGVLRVLEVIEISYAGIRCKNSGKRVLRVGRLPCLKELTIVGWKGRLEGLNSLTSLFKLTVLSPHIRFSFSIDKCSIPIENVSVHDPLLLNSMLSFETISSIKELSIGFFEGNSMDGEVFQSLTSLKRLYLRDCQIEHLPVHLKNLTSLQAVALDNCPNLGEIMESLPKNLCRLEIRDCPTLLERFNNGGSYRVDLNEGITIVTFPEEGQTMCTPSQPAQQAGTSQPAQQLPQDLLNYLLAKQHQSSTTTCESIDLTELWMEANLHGNTAVIDALTELFFNPYIDEAGPSRMANEEVEDGEEIVSEARRQWQERMASRTGCHYFNRTT